MTIQRDNIHIKSGIEKDINIRDRYRQKAKQSQHKFKGRRRRDISKDRECNLRTGEALFIENVCCTY